MLDAEVLLPWVCNCAVSTCKPTFVEFFAIAGVAESSPMRSCFRLLLFHICTCSCSGDGNGGDLFASVHLLILDDWNVGAALRPSLATGVSSRAKWLRERQRPCRNCMQKLVTTCLRRPDTTLRLPECVRKSRAINIKCTHKYTHANVHSCLHGRSSCC